MSKCLNLIKSYRQTREDVDFELWFFGIYPAFHSPKWWEKYRELKAKKKENKK